MESLTHQEKEEDYEVHLYISTIMLEDMPTGDKNTLNLATVPQPQPQPKLQQALILTQQQEEEETQTEKTKYQLMKNNIDI